MAEVKPPNIVGYLDNNQIVLFVQNFKSLLAFSFPPGMVSDLEVRKMEDLAAEFKNFLDQSKIPAGLVYLILGNDLLFEKEFPLKTDDQTRAEMEKFVKSVPFEHVGNREFLLDKSQKVVASNREFYETFQSVLESQGFSVLSVTPASMLSDYLKSGFNLEAAKRLLGKSDTLRHNSFIHQEEAAEEEMHHGSDPRRNKKLLALLLVFGVLLTVLGVMAGKLIFETKQTKKATGVPAPDRSVRAPPPPVVPIKETETATTSGISVASVKVQIVNSSGIPGQAANVKKQLADLGFRDIETGNGPIVNASKHIIAFSSNVGLELKQKITESLTKTLGELSVQEPQVSKYDVAITLTKISEATNSAKQTAP